RRISRWTEPGFRSITTQYGRRSTRRPSRNPQLDEYERRNGLAAFGGCCCAAAVCHTHGSYGGGAGVWQRAATVPAVTLKQRGRRSAGRHVARRGIAKLHSGCPAG